MAKLKLKNELMHSVLMLPTEMPEEHESRSLTDLVQAIEHAVSNRDLSSKSQLSKFVSHVDNDFDTSNYEVCALFPVCSHIYEYHDYMDTPNFYSLNGIYISSKSKAHIENLKNKLKSFTWFDSINWLSYLLKQNIRGNDNYIVALSNLSILLAKNLDNYNSYSPLLLSSKRDLLKSTIGGYYKQGYDSDKQLVDTKQVEKVNNKINKLLTSNQHYYLCGKDYTNKELHQKVIKSIEMIKNYLLQISIQGSKPITCPHCHLFTYSKYKYCQNCGAKLR